MNNLSSDKLKKMLYDAINELNIDFNAIVEHKLYRLTPAELVKFAIDEKDREISSLRKCIKTLAEIK